MTPVLSGRIQTRLFAIIVLGGIWTAIVAPFLPAPRLDLGEVYRGTFMTLGVVLVLGLVWELIYHGLQQFRWEKDWPTLFTLLTGINEGLLVALLLVVLEVPSAVPLPTFLWHFSTTWLVIFLFLNGPMRMFFVRWRYTGGRLVGG